MVLTSAGFVVSPGRAYVWLLVKIRGDPSCGFGRYGMFGPFGGDWKRSIRTILKWMASIELQSPSVWNVI